MTDKHQFDGRMVRISNVFDLQMGKTPSRKNPLYWRDGNHDWISIADLSSFGKYVGKTKEQINDFAVKESGIKPIPTNTVLMSFKLSLGKTSITTEPVYTNEAIMAFINKGLYSVDTSFMYHQCRSKNWAVGTNDAVMGKTLNKRTLGQSVIFLPSFEEQRSIAAKLDFIDEQLQKTKNVLQKLDSLVKSRFVEMFEDKGYPVSYLSHLTSSMRNGMSPSKSGSHHSKVLTLSAVTQGRFNSAAWKDGFFAEKPPIDKHVSVDDFYVCRGSGNIHLVGSGEYPDRPMEDVVFPDTMIAAKIKQGQIILPYLRYAWAQSSTRRQIEASAKTTNGTFKINQTMLGNIKIPVPPLKIQQEFADFAASVDKSRFVAQQQIEKLQMLYDSLAQEYFGE